MSEPVVNLSDEQTAVLFGDTEKQIALSAAARVLLSPVEQSWGHSDQVAMASYCLWASQRLAAIKQCVIGDLEHA